jgi:hypothetical protein
MEAAFKAVARPIPRLAPVIKTVFVIVSFLRQLAMKANYRETARTGRDYRALKNARHREGFPCGFAGSAC